MVFHAKIIGFDIEVIDVFPLLYLISASVL
jgi:hypothetical protein